MKKLIGKKVVIAAFIALLLPTLFAAMPVMAQELNLGINYAEDLGLAKSDPRTAAISLVRLLMTFLGIIAVVIMLYGGFMWLTAAGNEDRVSSAKKIIGAGVIGLVIILAAFLIVNFVVTNVSTSLEEAAI